MTKKLTAGKRKYLIELINDAADRQACNRLAKQDGRLMVGLWQKRLSAIIARYR